MNSNGNAHWGCYIETYAWVKISGSCSQNKISVLLKKYF